MRTSLFKLTGYSDNNFLPGFRVYLVSLLATLLQTRTNGRAGGASGHCILCVANGDEHVMSMDLEELLQSWGTPDGVIKTFKGKKYFSSVSGSIYIGTCVLNISLAFAYSRRLPNKTYER